MRPIDGLLIALEGRRAVATGRAQPVEDVVQWFRPERGGGVSFAPAGARDKFILPTGCASGGLAAATLCPWLQSAAPLGPKRRMHGYL